MLPYGRQQITDADVARVVETLGSDLITTGPQTVAFEEAVANRLGAKHAIAVCNGTAALHLALLAANVGPGDRVVTSPNTFLASANCAAYVGATPDFVDIDPVTYNLCPEKLESNWQEDTRAVIPVHYAGGAADVPEIAKIARSHNAVVIEDACHGFGGSVEFQGQRFPLGGHPWADITTFSFHPVKTLTTGEGGMIVTDNDELADRARRLRCHGMVRTADKFQGLGIENEEFGPWYYEMQELGFNFRITDFQCALGLSQLDRLDEYTERRREIVAHYNSAFSGISHVQVPRLGNENERRCTSWHLYTLQIDFVGLGTTRSEFMSLLRKDGIGSQVLYIPVYLQPFYRSKYGYSAGKCLNAEHFYERALSLPLFPAMTDEDVGHVIQSFKKLHASLCKKPGRTKPGNTHLKPRKTVAQ